MRDYSIGIGLRRMRSFGVSAICGLILLAGCETAHTPTGDPTVALGDLLTSPPPPPSARPSSIERSEALYREGLAYKEAGKPAWAAKRFQEAAKLDHPAAIYALAIAYRSGEGVGEDTGKAMTLTRRAAQLGNPQANYVLGAALYLEDGDTATAIDYLMQSADENFSAAEYLLGRIYAMGRGVRRDLPWALRWYGLAAAHGHSEAQFTYATSMLSGGVMPANLDEAVFWLGQAALQGHERANKLLRELDIEPDPKTQAAFARRLSHIGDAKAQLEEQPATVRYVQIRLKTMGHYSGEVDGMYGPMTEQAIETYWNMHSSREDAEITETLLQSLLAAS